VDDDLIAKNPYETGSVKRVKPRRSKRRRRRYLPLSWEQPIALREHLLEGYQAMGD
jgi:hypothetical protein